MSMATSTEEVASNRHEWPLRAHSDSRPLPWIVDDGYDDEKAARLLSAATDTWTGAVSPWCWCWCVLKTGS